jgi:hypothetical protein
MSLSDPARERPMTENGAHGRRVRPRGHPFFSNDGKQP